MKERSERLRKRKERMKWMESKRERSEKEGGKEREKKGE